MEISLEPGKYIVAVSGGVDSVVMLHLLSGQPGLKLVVAHYDHGIRPDSAEDRLFVQELANTYGLPFVYDRGELGPRASEAAARQARYNFLHASRRASAADAVVTAHHHDDVLETALLNVVRGTGRRGLTSLQSTDIIKRPLLHVPKADIIAYAVDNQLPWREDSTNAIDGYKRNYVRHHVLPKFKGQDRARLSRVITDLRSQNSEIDRFVAGLLNEYAPANIMERHHFIMLPHTVSREVMAAWLRRSGIGEIDRKLIEQLVHAAKTLAPGRRFSINRNNYLIVEKNDLALVTSER